MDNKVLLKKIKNTRLVKELSQEDMAKRLHISIPTYSRFERGVTKTNVNLLKSVSKILELDFFNSLENDSFNMINEDSTAYETKAEIIQKQLKTLIKLFEKQQEINTLILSKLKDLKEGKT
ncbi:MAG: helix-turn-helix transcriptional regulator [Bacteroidetes bacterium]|nr:helix-turn-helix transcriptional regulator [Bacteroidota bacterium]